MGPGHKTAGKPLDGRARPARVVGLEIPGVAALRGTPDQRRGRPDLRCALEARRVEPLPGREEHEQVMLVVEHRQDGVAEELQGVRRRRGVS